MELGGILPHMFGDHLKSEAIPSYTRLDTGLTLRWTDGLNERGEARSGEGSSPGVCGQQRSHSIYFDQAQY